MSERALAGLVEYKKPIAGHVIFTRFEVLLIILNQIAAIQQFPIQFTTIFFNLHCSFSGVFDVLLIYVKWLSGPLRG